MTHTEQITLLSEVIAEQRAEINMRIGSSKVQDRAFGEYRVRAECELDTLLEENVELRKRIALLERDLKLAQKMAGKKWTRKGGK